MFGGKSAPGQCRRYEARLEDYLGGALDFELEEHLGQCEGCSAALADSRMAGNWLRQAWEPAAEPGSAFLANVLVRIREEQERAQSPSAFWNPLAFLASRLALTAAVLLLALSAYMAGFAPRHRAVPGNSGSELTSADLPQPPTDPVSYDDVLQSLAERQYGR